MKSRDSERIPTSIGFLGKLGYFITNPLVVVEIGSRGPKSDTNFEKTFQSPSGALDDVHALPLPVSVDCWYPCLMA